MNKTLSKTVLAIVLSLAAASAQSETLFENPLGSSNGNCWFQCVGPGSLDFGGYATGYMADDFSLSEAATVSSIGFVGIRTSGDFIFSG